jgi:hypothetical protein
MIVRISGGLYMVTTSSSKTESTGGERRPLLSIRFLISANRRRLEVLLRAYNNLNDSSVSLGRWGQWYVDGAR